MSAVPVLQCSYETGLSSSVLSIHTPNFTMYVDSFARLSNFIMYVDTYAQLFHWVFAFNAIHYFHCEYLFAVHVLPKNIKIYMLNFFKTTLLAENCLDRFLQYSMFDFMNRITNI